MAFVQVIQYRTSKHDEMMKVGEEWEAAAGESGSARRIVACADRDTPGQFFTLVFFDSYESAMENSKLPETSEFAEKQAALTDAPMVFADLDVIEERD
jgi:hypothetical protein